MKSGLSSMDLHFLLDEFKVLVGGKIDQIYQKGKEEFIFQVHIPNVGKRLLRIVPGSLIYLASEKGGMPERPPGFCVYLRKYLKGTRIRDIRQVGFERIIEIALEAKEQKYIIVVELFSKGNLVLCDESRMVFSAMENQVWSDRVIRPKHQYEYPKGHLDIFRMEESQLSDTLKGSDRESLVKSLAMDFGLGGIYSEELCALSGVDKEARPQELAGPDIKKLFITIKDFLKSPVRPQQVIEGDLIKDIVPLELRYYKNFEKRYFGSFNEAIDEHFTKHESDKRKESVKKEVTKTLSKIDVMIDEQEKRIKGLERSAEENQRKGELIFENYQPLQSLLSGLNALRKKHSWDEIKAMLKENKRIKNLDGSKGEVTVEL